MRIKRIAPRPLAAGVALLLAPALLGQSAAAAGTSPGLAPAFAGARGLYAADGQALSPRPTTKQEMAQRLGELQQANTYTADPDMIGADGVPRLSRLSDLESDCKKEFPIPVPPKHPPGEGWVRDHYAWCTRQNLILKYSDKPADVAYFNIMILGIGSKDSRKTTFTVRLSGWVHPPGSGPEWATVPLSVAPRMFDGESRWKL